LTGARLPDANALTVDDNEILDFLRARFGRIDDRFDPIDQKLDEVVTRLGRLELEVDGSHADYAGLSVRLDNIDRRGSTGRAPPRIGRDARRRLKPDQSCEPVPPPKSALDRR